MLNMNKLVKGLLKFYSLFVRKTDDYIIFESNDAFFDNAYALYLYIKKNFPQYKLKYVTISKKMRQSGKERGVSKREMINVKNKVQLYRYSLKAKVIFFSYINYWKKLKLKESTPIVWTTHGEFAIKNCQKYYDLIFGPQENVCDVAVRTENTKQILCNKYPILLNHRPTVLGMPRNDQMFHSTLTKEGFLKSIGVKDYQNKSVILSMTTFRFVDQPGIDYFMQEFPLHFNAQDVNELDDILGKNNEILLIKLHHSQSGVITPKDCKNIYFINNSMLSNLNVGINEVYSVVDALISDFSTSYFGFLPLDRKEAFILADRKEYSEKRGYTVDDPESLFPGQKIYTKEEFFSFLENVNSDEDPFKEARRDILLRFVGDYKDQNCKSFTDHYLK